MRNECHVKLQAKEAVVRIMLSSIRVSRVRIKMNASIIENTSKRAAIEGSNSAMKRKGLDKHNVRGIAKCSVVSGLKAAAQNIKRFAKFMLGSYDAAIRKKAKFRGEVCPI